MIEKVKVKLNFLSAHCFL